MNAPVPATLKITTVNLSEDGTRVEREAGKANVPVTSAAALEVLRAFSLVPAMDLIDVDAKIYLAGPRGKIAVQNLGGRLFGTILPEAVNTAVERTPEDIIAWLTAREPAAEAEAGKEEAGGTAAPRQPRRWRQLLRSKSMVAVLAVATAFAAYLNFAPETAEGVEIIRDPAKVARLHAEFNGSYGAPGATTLLLKNGHLLGQDGAAVDGKSAPLFEKDYQFGLRGKQVVLLVDNGALLEPQPDGSLKFIDSTYPRQGGRPAGAVP